MDAELKQVLDAMREENARGFAAMREENAQAFAVVHRRIDGAQEENAREFGGMREENAREFDRVHAAHEETRRHFDVVTEATRADIRFLAEAIVNLDEKLDRKVAYLDEKIESTNAETQSLLRLSYATLDYRLRVLEERS